MLLQISVLLTAVSAQQWSRKWKPCNESHPLGNCDLRQKATLFGQDVYSPDYAGINRQDCIALRKPWAAAVRSWPFQGPPLGPIQESQRNTSLVVLYTTRTYTQIASDTTLTLASRVATHTNTLTPRPLYAVPTYPIAPPCSMAPPADCASRQAAARAADPTGPRGTPRWRNPHEELAPGCERGCGRARLIAEGVEVLHWPTPAPVPAAVQAGSTPMVTAGVAGSITVFDTRTPVVRIATVRAEDYCGPVGKELHGVTIRPAGPLSTGYGQPYRAPQSTWLSVDYRDFNQPIKKEVYQKLAACRVKEQCAVPVVNAYHPFMQLPGAVRALDPVWSTAYLDVYGYPMTAVELTPSMVPRPS
jgi:hypothetical protein